MHKNAQKCTNLLTKIYLAQYLGNKKPVRSGKIKRDFLRRKQYIGSRLIQNHFRAYKMSSQYTCCFAPYTLKGEIVMKKNVYNYLRYSLSGSGFGNRRAASGSGLGNRDAFVCFRLDDKHAACGSGALGYLNI